jgi:DivIVA domain-containing protein
VNDYLVGRIRNVRFTPVRLREGYDMREVDDFLDELVAAVTAGRPVQPLVAAARFTPVRLREGYDMRDVDQFLDEVVAFDAGADSAAPAGPAQPPVPPRQAVQQTVLPEGQPSVVQEQRGMFARLFGGRS